MIKLYLLDLLRLGLLIDPHSDSSLQLASETVLKNLGTQPDYHSHHGAD